MKRRDLPQAITLRGRTFSKKELGLIRRLAKKHFKRGRTYISKAICEELDWKQPNGWLKDRACRDVLLRLRKKRLVKLPPTQKRKKKKSSNQNVIVPNNLETIILPPITKYPKVLALELAKGNASEKVWNYLINTYHYLGHKVVVGRCLKYLVKADGVLVAAISFSSATWHLAPRNQILEQFMKLEEIRDLVINNSRFLILPNAHVPNLASGILSKATKRVVTDWTNYYSITPQVAETFVEPERFLGTCYRASNWLEIGRTKGYAKKGSSYHNSQKPKQIFLYGLSKSARRKIFDAVFQEKLDD